METKTLKIEIPNGYEIDKENSTFENIVFKKVDNIVIRWNKNYNGVEIKADGEDFILNGSPTSFMSWNDAMCFYNDLKFCKLPTVKQLQVVYKYFDEINNVIKENGGLRLSKVTYWCINSRDEFCAWSVNMNHGYTQCYNKCYDNFVRSVSAL